MFSQAGKKGTPPKAASFLSAGLAWGVVPNVASSLITNPRFLSRPGYRRAFLFSGRVTYA